MSKAKPIESIATRFKISTESAKYFLGRVQKSFKTGKKPPQQLIVDFMQGKRFKSLPEPHKVATMMNAAGVWTQAVNAEPPVLLDEPDIHF